MIEFTVYGKPIPQGSVRAYSTRSKKGVHYCYNNQNALLPYRQVLRNYAIDRLADDPTIGDDDKEKAAYRVEMEFKFVRPSSVKKGEKNTKPDLDKLQRAVLDALTGVAFHDDARVTEIVASKAFADRESTTVRVYKMREGRYQ